MTYAVRKNDEDEHTSEVCPAQKFCIFDLSILDSLQFQHYFQTNRHLQMEEEKPFNLVGANMGPVEWGGEANMSCVSCKNVKYYGKQKSIKVIRAFKTKSLL